MDQNEMMLEYLMEMGALQPQEEAIAQKRAMVNQLRQGGQLPGISTTPGGNGQPQIQQAASPMAFLGALGQQGLAAYQGRQADKMQDAYGAARRGALGDLRLRMGMQGQPRPQQQQPGFQMDTGDYGGGI